ncbi:MAG: response regulator [Bacteroidales bacterium]
MDTKNEKMILVVEDDDSNYLYLRTILEKQGHQLLRAKDGLEAIEYFKAHQSSIALVLLDIKIPELDGTQVAKAIKKISDTPIIAQTAHALSGDREKMLAAGCDDYISKPILRKELLGKINAL